AACPRPWRRVRPPRCPSSAGFQGWRGGATAEPSLGHRGNDPEPDTVAAVVGLMPVAIGTAAELGLGAPGPAARHSFLALRRPLRILPGRLAVIILAIPVRAPLPDVAVHVMQAEGIRPEPAHRGRERKAVVPGHAPGRARPLRLERRVRNVADPSQIVFLVADAEAHRLAPPTGVFP